MTTALTWAVTAVVVAPVLLVWRHRPAVAVALGAHTAVLGWLSAVDLRERRLPNRVVGPLAGGCTAWVVGFAVVDGDPRRAVVALAAGLAASVVLLALGFVGRIGMGDVKLAFPVGVIAAWLGAGAIEVTLLATALSSFLAAVAALAAGRGRHYGLPFGLFLALGSVAGILLAPRL